MNIGVAGGGPEGAGGTKNNFADFFVN